ncbi:MAG: 4-hydroxybenzoate octaprenyltransferase [Rhodocyclaceae bacterium]|nr:4-hydroxybenzoate octaprenyltransferase [Rhodocyclaceae bacterium]MBK6908486.1 4-hydroxybenzoate octaprenyltransferase [Rhodocyclaceae bacterium]
MHWPELRTRLDDYEKLMRLDKPIGILLLLWPTLWGLWFAARGMPHPMLLWIFVLGTVLMRSAGCVINDYADRDFDPLVERTKDRPLAARRVSTREALLLSFVLVLSAGALILPLSQKVWWLALAAVFLAGSYPFTKRFFALPQAYLGIAFGFGIPMAFAAVLDTIPPGAWVLLLANVFWAVAYDTEYAMVDRDDDLKIGIRTAAITFGRYDVAAIMVCYGAALGILVWAGWQARLGWGWYGGLALAGGFAGYHYTLIRTRTREGCFKAFRHNNWLGAAVFAGLFVDLTVRPYFQL